jgi:hypothetical protein
LKRYNAILTVGEYSRIGKKIAKGKFKLVERREGHPGAVYAVRIQNCSDWVYIVALRQKLVTALPASKRLKRLHEAQLTQPTE